MFLCVCVCMYVCVCVCVVTDTNFYKGPAHSSQTVVVDTPLGRMLWAVVPERDMPVTIGAFLSAVRDRHYVGTIFHRAEQNFLVQGGGRTTEDNMYKKSKYHPVKVHEYKWPNEEYAIAMAGWSQEVNIYIYIYIYTGIYNILYIYIQYNQINNSSTHNLSGF